MCTARTRRSTRAPAPQRETRRASTLLALSGELQVALAIVVVLGVDRLGFLLLGFEQALLHLQLVRGALVALAGALLQSGDLRLDLLGQALVVLKRAVAHVF